MVSPTSSLWGAAPDVRGRLVGEIQDTGEPEQSNHPVEASSLLPSVEPCQRFSSNREHSIAEVFLQNPTGKALQDSIVKEVNEGKRPTRIAVSVMIFGFFVIQALLLFLLIIFIPFLIGIEIFWLCTYHGNTFVLSWIGITVGLAGIMRTYTESSKFSKVQILHLRPLSPSIVFEPCPNCVSSNIPLLVSSNIPLLQLPIPTTISKWNGIEPWISASHSRLASLPRSLWTTQRLNHPMIMVLRPAKIVDPDQLDVKRLLYSAARGLFQALLLILLTGLFGSTYKSSILESIIFLGSFMTLMVISRTYSLYFCAWMEHATETIQIEYRTPAELTAIHTILVEMPSVFIHNTTSGRRYAGGNCVDPNPDCSNHTSSIAKPLPLFLRLATALFCGMLVFGIAVVLNYVLANLEINLLYSGFAGLSYLWIPVCIFVGLVVKKVYSDFEFVDTHGDYLGTVSPGGVVVV